MLHFMPTTQSTPWGTATELSYWQHWQVLGRSRTGVVRLCSSCPYVGLRKLQVTTGSYPHGVRQSLVALSLEGLIYDRVGVRKEGTSTVGFISPLLERPQVTPYQQTIEMKLPIHPLESANAHTMRLI